MVFETNFSPKGLVGSCSFPLQMWSRPIPSILRARNWCPISSRLTLDNSTVWARQSRSCLVFLLIWFTESWELKQKRNFWREKSLTLTPRFPALCIIQKWFLPARPASQCGLDSSRSWGRPWWEYIKVAHSCNLGQFHSSSVNPYLESGCSGCSRTHRWSLKSKSKSYFSPL